MTSLIPLGLSIAQIALRGLLTPALFRPRSIGPFVANVTVEEDHTDDLAVTDHPVQQGADMTDHAYKRPSRVRILVGYTNSSYFSLGDPNYVQNIYQSFLLLQSTREPFTIMTGKRRYTNMLIEKLHEHTDERTENSMLLTCECREVLIAVTQVVTVPPNQNMQSPEITGPVQNGGARSLQPGSGFNLSAAGTGLAGPR